MGMISVFLKIDEQCVADCLLKAREKLDGSQEETVLDFSSVARIDPGAVRAMEELAAHAEQRTIRVGLRGVNVHIYKVLKLAELAPRFSFLP